MPTATATRTAPLYRVTADGDNEAILTTRSGLVICYWRTMAGGYVREVSDDRPGTLGWQVSDELANMGNMLYCSEGRDLATMIRRVARSTAGRATIAALDEDHSDARR